MLLLRSCSILFDNPWIEAALMLKQWFQSVSFATKQIETTALRASLLFLELTTKALRIPYLLCALLSLPPCSS
jgi:hypothetical protein